MERPQLIAAIILSSICLAAIVIRLIWPVLAIDDRTIFLLALGVLPWLILFFKKIKLPGGFEYESRGRKQGVTDNPPPPVNDIAPVVGNQMSSEAKKILATLWRYQKQNFKDDYSKRWTFLIYPDSVGFAQYLKGVAELVDRGLITVRSDNNQVLLTNNGIHYVEQNVELQNSSDIYNF